MAPYPRALQAKFCQIYRSNHKAGQIYKTNHLSLGLGNVSGKTSFERQDKRYDVKKTK